MTPDGVEIRYETAGSGEPALVFVHLSPFSSIEKFSTLWGNASDHPDRRTWLELR